MRVLGPVRRFEDRDVMSGHEDALRKSLLAGSGFMLGFWFIYSSRFSPLWPALDTLPLTETTYEGLAASMLAGLGFGIIFIAGFFGFKTALVSVRPFEWPDLGVGLLGGFLSIILGIFLPYINPFQPSGNVTFGIPVSELDGIALMVLGLFVPIIIAPLAEEVMFRGWMQPALATTWLGPGGAIAISSLVFGFLHPHYFGAAISGVIFGLLRHYSGNLRAPIFAHMTHNAMVSMPFLF